MKAKFEVIALFLFVSTIFVNGQRKRQEVCSRDQAALDKEGRDCPNPCDVKPCRSRQAECLCDGACGLSCITKGQKCLKPTKLENGNIKFLNGTGFRAKIIYTCDKGYEIIGDNERFCQGNQAWTGPDPFCTKEGLRCEKPPFVITNVYADIDDDKKEFFVGDSVTYSCAIGYTQTKFAIKTTKCEVSKDKPVWKPDITLECRIKKCGYPDRLEYGGYNGEDFSFGKVITYYCNRGYNLRGIANRVCGADLEWSGYTPDCEIIECDYPNDQIPNGKVRFSSITYDSLIIYDCDDGYILDGEKYSKCQENGEWENNEPKCIEADCGIPEIPTKGNVIQPYSTKWKDIIKYQCWDNATSHNIMESECKIYDNKAKWSVPVPVCLEKCKRAKEDDAMYFQGRYYKNQQLFEHQSKLTVKCKKGSEISVDQSSIYTKTEAQTECNDGSWQPDVTCIPARCFCSSFPSDWFRNRRFEPYKCNQFHRDGDKISLTCPDEYPYSENVGNLECQRGIWKYGSKLECTPYPCSIESLRDNELKIEIALQHRTIKPSTIYGFQWKSSEHRNFEKEYAVPDGSEISLNCKFTKRELFIDDEFRGAELKLKCKNGEIVPDVNWECRPKRCQCNSFLKNEKFNHMNFMEKCNGLVNHGEKREVKCKDGFSSIKQKYSALCKEGDWILDDFVCKEMCSCDSFTKDVNEASLRIKRKCANMVAHENQLLLECEEGYSLMQGPDKALCSDGNWNLLGRTRCQKMCSCNSLKLQSSVRLKENCNERVDDGKVIRMECKEGYSSNRKERSAVCDNGEWIMPFKLVCKGMCSCDSLSKLMPFSVSLKDECNQRIDDGKLIEIQCKEGYSSKNMDGIAVCNNGEWKMPPDLNCKAICPCDLLRKSISSNVHIKGTCSKTVNDGTKLQLECSEGYSTNINERIATCDNGEWKIPRNFACKEIQSTSEETNQETSTEEKEITISTLSFLSSEKDLISVKENNVEMNTIGSSIPYSSIPSTIPSLITENNVPLTQLTTDEECDPFVTACFTDIECHFEKPDYVRVTLNGKLQEDRSFNVPDGAELIMRCENITQYYFDGDNKLKCNKGQWIGKIPSCIRLRERERFGKPMIKYEVGKRKAVIDIDGSLQVTTGEILKLSCLYFQSYSNIAKWSYRNLVDSQISFEPEWNMNQDAFEINLSPVKKDHETEYTCCMNEKLCNSIRIKVIELQCEEPPLPVNGFIRGSVSLSIDSEIEYDCDTKYLPEGGTKSKCILLQGSLKWSHSPPKCNEKLCETPPVPENGYIRKIFNRSVNTTVQFGCKTGYQLKGEESATCVWETNRLQWSKDLPKCVHGNPCYDVSINQGNTIYREDSKKYSRGNRIHEHGSKASFVCNDGLEISPKKELITPTVALECSNGQWLPFVTCVEARCSCKEIPKEMEERKLKFKTCDFLIPSRTYNVHLVCQEGFTVAYNYPLAHCARGAWDIAPVTRQNECKQGVGQICRLDLSNAHNLIATYRNLTYTGSSSNFDHDSVIKFRCNHFTKLEGNKNSTCNNGRWTSEFPTCVTTSTTDYNLPPQIYFISNDRYIDTFTDDGRIILPKNREIEIICWSNFHRQLLVQTTNLHSEFIKVEKQIITGDYTSCKIKSDQKVEARVRCSIGYNFHIFDIIFSDTCREPVYELTQGGLRIVPTTRQVTYTEGDEIEVESTSNVNKKNQRLKCMGTREHPGYFVYI